MNLLQEKQSRPRQNRLCCDHRARLVPGAQHMAGGGISTFSSTPAGTTMGLKESECGQMGVIMMAGTLGWIIEAPAATAYAVLPVGVDTITPGGAQRWAREGLQSALGDAESNQGLIPLKERWSLLR